jgi:hypothetical protein
MVTGLAKRFAHTVARDGDALRELMAPKVSFHALTPDRCRENADADVLVDEVILGTRFSPECSITRPLGVDAATVGAVDGVGDRFEATLPDDDFVVRHQANLEAENDKIAWLHILCWGFLGDN